MKKRTARSKSTTRRSAASRGLSLRALALVACALLAVLPPGRADARRVATRGPSVTAALESLRRSGQISEASYVQYTGAYAAAEGSLKKLSGTRKAELGSVIANTQQMAAANELTPSRLPVAMLTLERNRQWWSSERLLAGEERVSFPPSEIVWEHYPGQGVQIQWLATFGKANGYYMSGHGNAQMRQLLGEAIPLASDRAGGIAWEYMFHFDGGSPPWTSGLSQGTALQALAQAWSRFKEPAYLTAAQQALGIFETPPPAGVRVKTRAGAEYAEYTYAPGDRILNGFIQADVGLYEYAATTQDPLGRKLFEEGDAEARVEVPRYNTGAWSMYDQYGESDLNYHELLTEFLENLCELTRKGPPATTTVTPAPSSAPIAGDGIYCTTAAEFTADLHIPPVVSLVTSRLETSSRAGVQVALSKISTVRIAVRRGGQTVWSNSATVERGRPRLLWVTPSQPGPYTIAIAATDLAGNVATASGTITLSKR